MLTRIGFCVLIGGVFSCAPSIQQNPCPAGASAVVSRNFDTDCDGKVLVDVNDKGGALDARCASVGKADYACKFETKLSEICAHGIKKLTANQIVCSEPQTKAGPGGGSGDVIIGSGDVTGPGKSGDVIIGSGDVTGPEEDAQRKDRKAVEEE